MTDTHPFKSKLEHINYVPREDGIHEIVILKGSRQAVDEMFDLILALHEAREDKKQRLKFMYVYTAGNELPLNRVITRTRQDKDKWGTLAYGANVTANKMLANIVLRMLSPLGLGTENETRFFGLDEREAAVEWLLSCPDHDDEA